ncbi:MAG: flagellar export chaperone FlgN [Deltaproteobacteria bacterium]|jgi:hypothetical protein|nr:flagellar export chaperone FlgN [Deltaproteobacteria bacterium]
MDITLIQKLDADLGDHLARYRELIAFLDQEKAYLLSLDLDGLLHVSRAKEKLARNIIAKSEAFKESLASVALMLGLPLEPLPTLSEVGALCPPPFGARVADGAMTLARLKNQILRENSQAQAFVEESLGLVAESLNILSGANQIQGDGYKSDGKKEKGVKKALPSKLSRDI